MAAEISDRVREIAEARGLPESEVFERALERDLEDLWGDLVLARYLDVELDREETSTLTARGMSSVEHVGRALSQNAADVRAVGL